LNLRDVGPGRYELYCLPLRVAGADGAPARVVLRQS
jgi:arylformamidase